MPEILLPRVALRAQDIQTGLQDHAVAEFDQLLIMGMASRLAIHIRGKDAIEYELLKRLSFFLFGIPVYAFDLVITALQDVGFAKVVGTSVSNRRILPTVPYFTDLYASITDYGTAKGLNDFEQASIQLLERLAKGPADANILVDQFGLNTNDANVVLNIGLEGLYVQPFSRSDGSKTLISPVYFSENPDELASVVEKHGNDEVVEVLDAIRNNPGWPMSLTLKNASVGNTKLHPEQIILLQLLVRKGVLQPPSLTTAQNGTTHFLFTPPIGNLQVPVIEKDIYEKSMAVIAAARYGEHYSQYPIRSIIKVIKALLRDGYLNATTVAREQWKAAAMARVCEIKPAGAGWHEVHLIDQPENRRAIDLALQLLQQGDVMTDRGLDQNASLMLAGGGNYQESLRGFKSIRQQNQIKGLEEHHDKTIDKLLEDLEMGY
jgi:hypothetical protein